MPGAERLWGPWQRHDGRGMPVPEGTVVEAEALPPHRPPKHGITRRVGIAGVDLVRSWHWTPENRVRGCDCGWVLPIDRYRIRRAPGMAMLDRVLAECAPREPDIPMDMFDHEEA